MAVPATTLNIDIADYKAVIEQWTTVLDRAHSWETPQRVTVYRRSLAPSPEIEHDMIRLGDIKLNESNGRSTDRDLEVQILIDFFRKLPSLSDLEWRIDTLLMPPLLEFLRDELPGCNLHLMPFEIGCDAEPSYVQSILSLPGLRTIWFRRNFYGCEEEIMQHMARASNGNVREVRIYWSSPGASPFGEPLPPMWEQKHAGPDGQRLGQVQSLQLSGMSGANESDLKIWARHTDLGHLRTLSLESLVTPAALETLNNLPLQSLHSLGMHIDWRDKSDRYNAVLQKFICNLPALSRLRLTGDLQPRALEAILDHLDPTLHTLYLIPGKTAFDSSTIALVTDRCKYVQELGITMKRAWNKPGEDIAVLKALGRMPQLSRLDLTFDASDPTLLFTDKTDKNAVTRLAQSDPSFSAFDREMFSRNGFGLKEVRNGHIRDAFVNSAIDADLARAVFNTILSGTPDGGSLLLRRLSLKSTGGGYFNTGSHAANITNFAEELGREWVVERSDYDDALEVHRVEVEDIWVEPPYVWSDASSDEDVPRLPGGVEDIFRRIWPGNGDWTEEWHSFPLLQ